MHKGYGRIVIAIVGVFLFCASLRFVSYAWTGMYELFRDFSYYAELTLHKPMEIVFPVGNLIHGITNGMSAAMCIIALCRWATGKFIITAGGIALAGWIIQDLLLLFWVGAGTIGTRELFALYLATVPHMVIPIGVILCGVYWKHYVARMIESGEAIPRYPFFNKWRIAIAERLRSIGDTEDEESEDEKED